MRRHPFFYMCLGLGAINLAQFVMLQYPPALLIGLLNVGVAFYWYKQEV